MGIKFLDLGKQPLANGFLNKEDFDEEFFFNLSVKFNPNNYLVSLLNFVPKDKMFNKNYVYHSSGSSTMRQHFYNMAQKIPNTHKLLEIGSNDGVFINHFDPKNVIAIEPCENFANITRKRGYTTYDHFWNLATCQDIINSHGKFDTIYSANCMCHIQNIEEAFHSVSEALHPYGSFIFEDPYLLDIIKNDAYDQFYDEHAHYFSILFLDNILRKVGLYICDVEHLSVHGGSNRIYARKMKSLYSPKHIENLIDIEIGYGLDSLHAYDKFANRVTQSKETLKNTIEQISSNSKIVGYGATSKSTVVYNYCNIGPNEIEYIIDTTPSKQEKYSPGTHIPIVPPTKINTPYVFLGAWNYRDEIFAKEKNRHFSFITHVPKVMVL